MAFKEIPFSLISEYKNPFCLFDDNAVAIANGTKGSNALTIGWGSLGLLWRRPTITIYIHEKRYSKLIFDNADTFAVCFFDHKDDIAIDNYYGRLTGKFVNKVDKGPFPVTEYDGVKIFANAELVIIARKMAQSDFDVNHIYEEPILEWYKKDGVHTIYYGEIVKILRKEL